MSRVEKSALVLHPAARMFELVADVEGYKDFLPWCSDSRLLSRDEQRLCGEIEVSRAGIRQRFTTCNDLEKDRRMGIQLEKGPFRRLEGVWLFTPLREDACKVELQLEFEFSGALIDKAFGRVFNQIAGTLVDAFCRRADQLYG
ncbi:MAG: type II toxin-antitoxin system RatA family toxin [Gammaproteobacteria bacterium SHHR-1]|uniref:type II toxin-antitoxin system RatA family toxin n=1 Tax=Magnetovirga frankeli TaxID=947516 RepID=UPI001293947F|nr:type II toxin-antitoxin system RatA family toxin [gamma proteobacterium SS-5]